MSMTGSFELDSAAMAANLLPLMVDSLELRNAGQPESCRTRTEPILLGCSHGSDSLLLLSQQLSQMETRLGTGLRDIVSKLGHQQARLDDLVSTHARFPHHERAAPDLQIPLMPAKDKHVGDKPSTEEAAHPSRRMKLNGHNLLKSKKTWEENKVKTLEGSLGSLLAEGSWYTHIQSGAVVLNILCVCTQIEMHGSCKTAPELGLQGGEMKWGDIDWAFDFAEIVFSSLYLVDLVLHLVAHGDNYFRVQAKQNRPINWLNAVNAVVVLLCCVDAYFIRPLAMHFGYFNIVKYLRILVAFKPARIALELETPRLLLKSLQECFLLLFSGMVLIFSVIISVSILMFSATEPYILDANRDLDARRQLFDSWGSISRAAWSLFIATFTAGWVKLANELIAKIHWSYAFLWLAYVVFVNFAIIRVLAGMFVQNCKKVADGDAKVKNKMKQEKHNKVKGHIRELLTRIGHGKEVDSKVLDDTLQAEEGKHIGQQLGLSPMELEEMLCFAALSDNKVDEQELTQIFDRLKDPARLVDLHKLRLELTELKEVVQDDPARLVDLRKLLLELTDLKEIVQEVKETVNAGRSYSQKLPVLRHQVEE